MTDIPSPLTLATTDELIDELERRSNVTAIFLLQRSEHDKFTAYRRVKWQRSSIFEAIGVMTLATTQLQLLVAQSSNMTPTDNKPD